MNMVPHKQFTSAADVLANAKAVRQRLMNPVVYKKVGGDERIKELEAQIDGLRATVEEMEAAIEAYRLNQADFEAVVMSQAHMLVDMFRKTGGESEKVMRKAPRVIIEEVLERDFPNISFFDVVGPKRTKALVEARHACMVAVYEARKDLSFPQIGRIFNRDHTVILYACNRLKNRPKTVSNSA